MTNLDFIAKIEEKYGGWNRNAAQFGNTSYGDIANDLCYSNSHFTKLMSGSASDAMYERASKNIEGLIKYDTQNDIIQQLEKEKRTLIEQNFETTQKNKFFSVFKYAIPLLIAGLVAFLYFQMPGEEAGTSKKNKEHPMSRYFDRTGSINVKTPYLSQAQVHDYCSCSAFEGVWNLAEEYKMPLPGNKPGLYYLAKSADVRMKCQRGAVEAEKGTKLLGFENIHNEVWLDKTRTAFTPKYFDVDTKSYTAEFLQLDFENNDDFVKIADVYSCFFDEFTIDDEQIQRNGETCGRYAEITDERLVNKYKIDINNLLNSVIGNMTSTSCKAATNRFCNPNDLKEGESTFSFDCLFSIDTENLGFGGGYPYSKGYKLIEQNYSSNLLCECSN